MKDEGTAEAQQQGVVSEWVESSSLDDAKQRVSAYANEIYLSQESIENGTAQKWLDALDKERHDYIYNRGATQLEGWRPNLIKI